VVLRNPSKSFQKEYYHFENYSFLPMWPKEDRVAHTISRLSAFYPLSEADEPL
jgi:hypothetical protein